MIILRLLKSKLIIIEKNKDFFKKLKSIVNKKKNLKIKLNLIFF